jgi:hypothetical protein
MTHRLQSEFAREEGEARYVERLRKLVTNGYLDAAEGILITDLASLDSEFAAYCAGLKREHVELSGWPELIDAMSLFEGESITGMTIGMANDADLNFEKGVLHAPYLLLGLYTDEAYRWSAASREDILDQLGADAPQWAGCEEDIEIYLEIEGLETINTALIHHKHRFFLRDGAPDKAPLGYVEYVLASWLRALRFHQAIAAQIAEHGLPGSVPVVSGTVDLRPEIATVHFPEKSREVEQAQFASLTAAAPRRTAEIIEFERPNNIRAQIAAANANAAPEPEPEKPGLFGRMFGRR